MRPANVGVIVACSALSAALWLPVSLRLAGGWSPGPAASLGLFAAKLAVWTVPLGLVVRPRWDELRLGVPRLEGWAFAAGFGYLALVNGLQMALSGVPPALHAVGVGPVNDAVEEIAFRGLLLAALEATLSPRWANLVCAALFVAVHVPAWWVSGLRVEIPFAMTSIGLLALVLGFATQRTGSIWLGWVVHVLNNALVPR